MNYDDVIAQARTRPIEPPPFETLGSRIGERRAAHASADQAVCTRARRWLYLALFGFLLMPADMLIYTALGEPGALQGLAMAIALPIAMLAWASRLVFSEGFRDQVLVRSIAASNLIVALLLALSIGGVVGALGQSLIAIGCAQTLRLLGDRGLYGHEQDSTFTPIAFRGFLILALIMAFADAQTLGFSALTQASFLFSDDRTALILSHLLPTAIASLVMVLNVWGLLRLKTWAMLLNIVANLAIARMALTGALSVNLEVALSLSVTAAIQLLLPVPILAAALGDRNAGGRGWRWGAVLLRAAVPLMVVLTIGTSIHNFGRLRLWGWLDGSVAAYAARRGLDMQTTRHRGLRDPGSMPTRIARGETEIVGHCDPGVAYGPMMRPELVFKNSAMQRCDLAGADAREWLIRRSNFANVDLSGANLVNAAFVDTRLDGANFRGARLDGAMFVFSRLENVEWEGATCPDGFVATADVGCEAHLAHGHVFEAAAVAGRLATTLSGCELSDGESDCTRKWVESSVELVAQDQDLLLEWGAPFASREPISFVRHDGASWIDASGKYRVVALPSERYMILSLGQEPQDRRWLLRLTKTAPDPRP